MQLGSAGDALTSSAANFPWCHQAFWVGDQTHLLLLMWLVIWIYWVFFWVQTLPAFLEQMAFSRFYLCVSGSSKMVPSSLCPVFFQVMGKLMETEHISAFNPRLLAKGVAHIYTYLISTLLLQVSCKLPFHHPTSETREHLGAHLLRVASFSPLVPPSLSLTLPAGMVQAASSWASSNHPPGTNATAESVQDSCLVSPPQPPLPPSLFPHQPGCPPFSWASPKVWCPKPKLGNISPFTQLSASAVMWEHSSSSPATSCWQPSRMTMTQ